MALDRLKDILRAEMGSTFDKFSKWYDELDKYLEEVEEKYEKEGKFKFESDYDPRAHQDPFEKYRNQQDQQQHQSSSTTNQMSKEDEYYAALELKKGASFEEIKKAYRSLMKKYHPDLFENDQEKKEMAMEVSRQVNEAYFYFKKKFKK